MDKHLSLLWFEFKIYIFDLGSTTMSFIQKESFLSLLRNSVLFLEPGFSRIYIAPAYRLWKTAKKQSKHLACIQKDNNATLGYTWVVVNLLKIADYVKYASSMRKPKINFSKLKCLLMMTTLVICSSSIFIVESTRKLLIENTSFILCFEKAI